MVEEQNENLEQQIEEVTAPEPTTYVGINIPIIPLEEFEIPDTDIKSELGIENEYDGSVEFGIIGCGQAGGRIAMSFHNQGYKKCLAINTAKADLNPL